MNIGVDIDGVLTDYERITIDYGTKMCVEENWPINIDLRKYYESEKFNFTEEQEEKFWNRYLVEYVTKTNPRAFSAEIIGKLQQEGNNIYIITARDETGMPPEYYGKMQELTKNWLDKNKIKYKKLIFDKRKLEQCIKNNIDIMIEDSPENIESISQKIKVIKFDSQYNKTTNGKNIITAYSWHHIYRIIKEMRGEKNG